MKRRKISGRAVLSAVLTAILVPAGLVGFFAAVGALGETHGEEQRRQLENALRRGAVACYAAEGIYPPDAAYLAEHYGVQIDEERYCVFYEIFADNLMPEITVLER